MLATIVRIDAQSGDTMIIQVRVQMATRDGQNWGASTVRVSIKAFPDGAWLVQAN